MPTRKVLVGTAIGQHEAAGFYTKYCSPVSVGTDALVHGDGFLWVFPPFHLLGAVISELLHEQVNAILIVPRFLRYRSAMIQQLPVVDIAQLPYHAGLYEIGSRARKSMQGKNNLRISLTAYLVQFPTPMYLVGLCSSMYFRTTCFVRIIAVSPASSQPEPSWLLMCIISPLRLLCTLCPVYMLQSFRCFVSRCQMASLFIKVSAKVLVPFTRGLTMLLVIGWPAARLASMAKASQVLKHMRSQVSETVQCPPFLFLVLFSIMCSCAPGCSFTSGVRNGTAESFVGSLMLSSLMLLALKPLKVGCQRQLIARPPLMYSSLVLPEVSFC